MLKKLFLFIIKLQKKKILKNMNERLSLTEVTGVLKKGNMYRKNQNKLHTHSL